MSAAPHRERFEALEGLEEPARLFEEALAAGRLHHAWLLTGPKGLGKAGFAFRAARRLLGARPTGTAPLGSAADDPVNRLLSARAHPDFLLLDRDEGGENRRTIPVDEARRLPEFFSKAAGPSGRRVAIVDAADDLNPNAANAVLKTLEEPPPGGVLLLVCHAPGKLLPTIRSRCRRLSFRAWSPEALARFAQDRGLDVPEGALSPGDVLAQEGRAESFDAEALIASLPALNARAVQALVDRMRGAEGAAQFAAVCEALARAVRRMALGEGAAAAAWSAVWQRLVQLPTSVEAVNLDRGDALWSVLSELRAVAARRAA